MKKRFIDVLLSSQLYLTYMLLSCLAIMFVEMLAVKIVNLFVVVDPLSLCVMRAAIYTVGVNTLLGIAGFREGYKSAKATPVSIAISAAIATLAHSLIGLLFSFEAFCAGGVKFVATLVKFGRSINGELFTGTMTRFDMIPFFFINSAVYIAIMIGSNKLGAMCRLKQRKQLNLASDASQDTQ